MERSEDDGGLLDLDKPLLSDYLPFPPFSCLEDFQDILGGRGAEIPPIVITNLVSECDSLWFQPSQFQAQFN